TLRSCVMHFSLLPPIRCLMHLPDGIDCLVEVLFEYSASVSPSWSIHYPDHILRCTQSLHLEGIVRFWSIVPTHKVARSMPDAIHLHWLPLAHPHFVIQECVVAQWRFVPMLAQTVQQQVSSMTNAREPILAMQWLFRCFLWPMSSLLQRDLYCLQRLLALAHYSSLLRQSLRLLQLLVHTAQSLWHRPDPKWQPLHPHPEVQQFASICHAGSPASQHHLGLKHPMRPVRYIHPVNGLPDISVLHRQIPTTRAIRQYLQSAIPAG